MPSNGTYSKILLLHRNLFYIVDLVHYLASLICTIEAESGTSYHMSTMKRKIVQMQEN